MPKEAGRKSAHTLAAIMALVRTRRDQDRYPQLKLRNGMLCSRISDECLVLAGNSPMLRERIIVRERQRSL